ncbi:MAG: hypothetical protein R3300_16150 [Candidatus Promineifilaceae bacterium]|nr:hypothetical protein [Candidatus Promineifilaceae bacterium]
MPDTQWPRFEVFQQDRAGRPYQNVGSVHAPDAEMALQNARDVFVRRPRCHGLWVVPAESIVTSGLQATPVEGPGRRDGAGAEEYCVFGKTSQRRSMSYVSELGRVTAANPRMALAEGQQKFADETVYAWWVFPVTAVVSSRTEDVESMFAPAEDKDYRMPQQYRVFSEMMALRQDEEDRD